MIKPITVALMTAVLLAGCQTVGNDGVHVVQPRDIPVPLGMKLKTQRYRSNSLEVDDYRYANLVYEGYNAPMDVASYMLERMPQHDYRLVSQEKTANQADQLVFQRGQYVATCTVRGLEHRTRLEIRVRTHPKL